MSRTRSIAARAADTVVGARAAARRARAFHPDGVLCRGTAVIDGNGLPLASGPVLVRISKALGAPLALPDLVGIAIRFPTPTTSTADPGVWDVLMAGPVRECRRIPLPFPATSWRHIEVSTLTCLTYRGARWTLAGRLRPGSVPVGLRLRALADGVAAGEGRVELFLRRDDGPFSRIGDVRLEPPVEDAETSFDPVGNRPADVD
ncbi:hypothetical protein [Gordonia alkaliphila]|uniref:Uncharacterized protein n=1 Tax=Gordonia alkaliphila TaxID=1053547 RepID=A0ABP8Z6T3_9ACTN